MGRDSNPCPSDLETKIMTSQLTHILSFPRSFLFLFHFLFILFLSSSPFSSSSVPIYLILISLSSFSLCRAKMFPSLAVPPSPFLLFPFSVIFFSTEKKHSQSVLNECRVSVVGVGIEATSTSTTSTTAAAIEIKIELNSNRIVPKRADKKTNCFSISCHRGKTSCFCGTLEGTSGL